MSYADIRKAARKGHNAKYATGGAVKGRPPSTVINIVQPPAAAPAAGPGPVPPMPMGAPSPMPAAPVPPIAGNAALGAMGAPPALKTGGRVKFTAGAGSGEGRQQKAARAK